MESIGGYRLVRSLGVGARAEVWLGHGGPSGGSGGGAPAIAAVKVFRPSVPIESIDTEIEALGRASSRHLVRLDDLASAPDGRPCLILQRLSVRSLGRLLAARRVLDPGEAVTILAPVALAVAELHRVGVAHAALRPSAVLFDDAGAPVITGFGSAQLVGDFPEPSHARSLNPAQLAERPAVAEDLDQLTAISRFVLEGVPGGTAITAWLDATGGTDRPENFAADLADRLFGLGVPRAVRFERQNPLEVGDALPQRLSGEVPAEREPGPVSSVRGWMAVLHLPDGLDDTLARWLDSGPLSSLREKLGKVLGPVRKPVWILAGAVVVGLVAVLAFTPQGDGPVAMTTDAGPTAAPAPTSEPVLDASVPDPAPDPAVARDDPVAAARVLLALRARCIRDLSVLCLDSADQQDSAAMDADSYLIRTAQEGGVVSAAPDLTAASVLLVERLGDTALLTVAVQATPVSLLLARGDAGWRIRDLVVGAAAEE